MVLSMERLENQVCEQLIKEDCLYDYIANHYYLFSKEQLKELILNIYWVATERLSDNERKMFNEVLNNELENRGFYEE